MAAFGDFHHESGAGWSVYWRISKQRGSGLEIWWADFHGRRVMWRGTQPFAIVPYHRPVTEPPPPEHTYTAARTFGRSGTPHPTASRPGRRTSTTPRSTRTPSR